MIDSIADVIVVSKRIAAVSRANSYFIWNYI